MRHLILALLLLSATTMAAETLSNAKLENTYIPGSGDCQPSKGKKLPKSCKTRSGSRVVTDKALRDAEQQNTNQALGNPQRNNPDITPLPTQLPPPTVQQQNLQHLLENLKNLPAPAP